MIIGSTFVASTTYAQQTLKQMSPEMRADFKRDRRVHDDVFKKIKSEGMSQNLVHLIGLIFEQYGNEAMIVKNLGEPKLKADMPGLIDKMGKPTTAPLVLEYEGFKMMLMKTALGKAELVELNITSDNSKLDIPIRVGMSKESVIDYLGRSGYNQSQVLAYYWLFKDVKDGTQLVTSIVCKNEKVAEIRFFRLDRIKRLDERIKK